MKKCKTLRDMRDRTLSVKRFADQCNGVEVNFTNRQIDGDDTYSQYYISLTESSRPNYPCLYEMNY